MQLAALDKDTIKAEAALILLDQGALEAAHYLAETLFQGRTDWGGNPYFGHLERVANGIADPAIKPIGYLHDLIEDIPGWTFEDLREIGFSAFIVDGVEAVTKKKGAPYFDEIVRASLTPQAIPSKRSDLKDNCNLLRLPHLPTPGDIERTRKYYLSDRYLSDIESGKIAPGTAFADWMDTQPPGRQDKFLLHKYSRHPGPAAPGGTPAPKP